MLPTELQRILLLIGMAATGYLMILAWNEDYGNQLDVEAYASDAPVAVSDAAGPVAGPAPDIAAPAPALGAQTSDAPDDSLLDPDAVAPVASTPAVAAGPDPARTVTVSTPTLRVVIDRLGGDIVSVALPEYPITLDRPDVPYRLLESGRGRTYIAQSGLIGRDGIDKGSRRPLYSAPRSEYTLTPGDSPVEVVLTATEGGFEVSKTFTFSADSYVVALDYEVGNRTEGSLQAALFAQIKRDRSQPLDAGGMALGPQPYLGGALTTSESRYEKIEFDDLDDDGDFRETVQGGWVAFLQHYFLSAWVADPELSNRYYGQRRGDGTYVFGFVAPAAEIAPGEQARWRSQFYAGPKDQERLEALSPNLNLTVDYGFLWWLAVPLFKVLKWCHDLVGNWGMAIILLTIFVKALLWPLTAKAYKSMANMRRVAPQMKRLQERYASDRQKLSQEMMKLYQKEGVNPLGGCLPMLLPMPIFLALYWVLFESVELRQAPFMAWIQDLAVMDPFFVLPLLMGASMYLQQLLSPAMGDPMQVKIMRMMPVVFTALFLFFPAGLVLYWLVNNVISIAQQYWVNRQADAAETAGA
ncbi:MAG: membrane protein insertase YidC [Pseudomonadota bacterium]